MGYGPCRAGMDTSLLPSGQVTQHKWTAPVSPVPREDRLGPHQLRPPDRPAQGSLGELLSHVCGHPRSAATPDTVKVTRSMSEASAPLLPFCLAKLRSDKGPK